MRAPRAPLFPYTTLFRSVSSPGGAGALQIAETGVTYAGQHRPYAGYGAGARVVRLQDVGGETVEEATSTGRSEEHTSELQSRRELVCRLLLEKKTSQAS